MFTFLHAADIHLDSPMHKLDAYEGAPVDAFRQSTRRAFKNLVSMAIADEALFLLIAGDLYDGDWKDYNTGLFFVQQMHRLRDAGIQVFITAGNHDAASTITRSLRMPENVTLFPANRVETVTLREPPVAIHGRSFATPSERDDLSLSYPPPRTGYFNIGLLHTCGGGRPGHEPYAPCSIEGLRRSGYQYWALGHVHQYEVLSENPPVVFPGNLQGRHIRECGPKGAVEVVVDDELRASRSFVETDVVRWLVLEVETEDLRTGWDVADRFSVMLDEAASENRERPLAIRVVLKGRSAAAAELLADRDRWTNQIRALAMEAGKGRAWVEKIVYACSPPDADALRLRPQAGAVNELLALLKEVEEDEGARARLGQELSDLSRKIPRALKEEPDPILLEDPEFVGKLLCEAGPELLGRLLKPGED
jgi:DNA repair exonuclease SbcCD nuclease subunit